MLKPADILRRFEDVTGRLAQLRIETKNLENEQVLLRRQLRDGLAHFIFLPGGGPDEGADEKVPTRGALETVDAVRGMGPLVATKKTLAKRLNITPAAAAIRLGRAARCGLLERTNVRGEYRLKSQPSPNLQGNGNGMAHEATQQEEPTGVGDEDIPF